MPGGVIFTKSRADQIEKATDAVLGAVGQRGPSGALAVLGTEAWDAIVTTEITASSGTTWGVGAVRLYYGRPGAALTAGRIVTCYNWYSAAVPVGRKVQCMVTSGYMKLIGADCPV
jgi:hypothetical protein